MTAKTNIANIENKKLEKQIANILTKDIDKNIQKNAITVSTIFKQNFGKIDRDTIELIIKEKQTDFNILTAVCISHEDYQKIIKILKEIDYGNEA